MRQNVYKIILFQIIMDRSTNELLKITKKKIKTKT